MPKKNKGQSQLTGFALSIIVFALVLAISLVLLSKLMDTGESSVLRTDDNNTFTALNVTAVAFATDWSTDSRFVADSCRSVKIYNATNEADITSQFSISGCEATLTPADNLVSGDTVTANYSFLLYIRDYSYNATEDNITSVSTIPSWIPILIVAFIGGFVIFLIIRQLGV